MARMVAPAIHLIGLQKTVREPLGEVGKEEGRFVRLDHSRFALEERFRDGGRILQMRGNRLGREMPTAPPTIGESFPGRVGPAATERVWPAGNLDDGAIDDDRVSQPVQPRNALDKAAGPWPLGQHRLDDVFLISGGVARGHKSACVAPLTY